jgi:hypothetical protein
MQQVLILNTSYLDEHAFDWAPNNFVHKSAGRQGFKVNMTRKAAYEFVRERRENLFPIKVVSPSDKLGGEISLAPSHVPTT